MPGRICQFGAVSHIGKKYLPHTAVDSLVIDEKIAFEIVFEASEIEICRACRDDIVIYYHGFGMKHSGIVEIDFYTGLETLGDISE